MRRYMKKLGTTRRELQQVGIDADLFMIEEAPWPFYFCHEGPYCRICHDPNILAKYLQLNTFCRGIIISENVLSYQLLDKLAQVGPKLPRFQWLIIKNAYGSMQIHGAENPTLFSDFEAFFSNPGFRHLRRLAIIGQQFSDKDLMYLAKSPFVTNLEELALMDNCITKNGVRHLQKSSHLPNLRLLNLTCNKWEQKEAIFLLNSLNFSPIKVINNRPPALQKWISPKSWQDMGWINWIKER